MNAGDVVMHAMDPAGPLILSVIGGGAVALLAWTWAQVRDRSDDDRARR